MRYSILVAALLAASSRAAAPAAPAPGGAEAQEHAALRLLHTHLVDSINKMDVEGMLSDLHPNVVITWQNAEVSRGRQGVRDYLSRMMGGSNPIVKSFKTEINVDELTALHGESTGIAFGGTVDQFSLTTGQTFTLRGRWTATLVKEQGRWLVAGMHVSTNLFDNPLLNAAKKALWIGVPASFLAALALGLFVGGRFRRAA